MKTCSTCRQEKALEKFYRHRMQCKDCYKHLQAAKREAYEAFTVHKLKRDDIKKEPSESYKSYERVTEAISLLAVLLVGSFFLLLAYGFVNWLVGN